MRSPSIFVPIALVALLGFAPPANSQVLIPDANMRTWFNTLVPGIVDQAGIMDTTNASLASIDSSLSLSMTLPFGVYSMNMDGIQYLHNTRSLFVNPRSQYGNRHINVLCPALPYQLRSLQCQATTDTLNLDLPACPNSMTALSFNSNYRPLNANIASPPEQVEYLSFLGLVAVEWQGQCNSYRTFINYSNSSTFNIQIPSLSSNFLVLSDCQFGSLDLSNTTIDSVLIENINTSGLILWPLGLHHMDYGDGVNFGPSQQLPPTLTSLNFLGMPSCLPLLPDSLIQVNNFSSYPLPCIPN